MPIVALGLATFFLVLSAFSTYKYLENERRNKILNEYRNFDCEQMKNQFEVDLKNHKLKFFSVGFVENQKLRRELQNFGIEDFYQGCIITLNTECYNQLIEKYLRKEKNVDLKKLWK